MKHLRIFVSEFGNAPYACAHRYNALLELFLENKDPVKLSVVTSLGKIEKQSFPISRFWTLNMNCREGSLVFRVLKEIIYGLFSFLSLFFDKHKMVIISVPNFLSGLIICFGCRLLRIPYCFDLRDLYPDSYVLGNLLSEKGVIFKFLYRLSISQYKEARCLFVCTKGIGQKLQLRGLNQNKIFCITNGFPKTICDGIDKNVEKYKRDIIFHGTLGKMQNINYLSLLIKSLPEYSFTIIGDNKNLHSLKKENYKNLLILQRMNYLETLSIVAVHKIGLCIRNGTWYDKISLPVKIFEYLGLNLHVIGFPETEFSKDIKLKNILTEFAHFDIPEIKEKIKEIIEKKSFINDIPKYLSREFQSNIFRRKIFDVLGS